MGELLQIFRFAGQNFIKWRRNPRIFITFLLAFVLGLMLSDEILFYAQKYEVSIQILEPFIWTYGDQTSVMLSSLLLLLLFADMPFVDQETPYQLIRTRRSTWLAGQVVYVITATILYQLFLLTVQMIFASPMAFVGNVWSKTAAMLGYGGAAKETIPVSIKIMESVLPYECALWVFLLMLCYLLFLSCVMLCFNLIMGNPMGVLGAFAVNLYGIFLNPALFQKMMHLTEGQLYRANVLCGWVSPLNHATFSMHNFGYDYLPKVGVSIGLFVGIIAILLMISKRKMRTYNFTFIQTDE